MCLRLYKNKIEKLFLNYVTTRVQTRHNVISQSMSTRLNDSRATSGHVRDHTKNVRDLSVYPIKYLTLRLERLVG